MDMSLSKLWELVIDRESGHSAGYGVAKSQTQMSEWTEPHASLLFPASQSFKALLNTHIIQDEHIWLYKYATDWSLKGRIYQISLWKLDPHFWQN